MICLSKVIKSANVSIGSRFWVEPFAVSATALQDEENNTKDIEKRSAASEYERLIQQAQKQAEEIMIQGYEAVEKLKQAMTEDMTKQCLLEKNKAYDEGMRQGYEDGYAQGYEKAAIDCRQENLEVAEQLNHCFSEFEAKKQALIEENIDNLKYLALDIATKVIYDTVTLDPDCFLPMIKTALEGMRDYKWVEIYISSEEKAFGVALDSKVADMLPQHSNYVRVKQKDDLPKGSCIIQTDVGVVDASLHTQLEQVKNALED